MDIKKILIEIDPRKRNAPAIRRAQAIAEKFGAAVDVLAYESVPPFSAAVFSAQAAAEEARRALRSDLDKWAKEQVKPMREAGIEVSVESSWERPHHEVVCDAAERSKADLVVRVASRHGRLERMFIGAADWELIRQIEQPLWLVQSEDEEIKDGLNVLAAVDPMHPDDEAMVLDHHLLDAAKTLSTALSGEMHVYHAVPVASVAAPYGGAGVFAPSTAEFEPELMDKVRAAHRSNLNDLLTSFDVDDDNVHMVEGDPAGQIKDTIEEHDISVVVAGGISRSWLQRLLIGSTAESLFNSIDCDLVVIRASDKDEKAKQ